METTQAWSTCFYDRHAETRLFEQQCETGLKTLANGAPSRRAVDGPTFCNAIELTARSFADMPKFGPLVSGQGNRRPCIAR